MHGPSFKSPGKPIGCHIETWSCLTTPLCFDQGVSAHKSLECRLVSAFKVAMANEWQAGQSSGWSRQQWQSHDNHSDTSMQNEWGEWDEWDGGWVVPEPLEEAEMVMRTRTTKPTPIEYDNMVQSMETFELPQPYMNKVCKHWGKRYCLQETKTLMSCVATKMNYVKGEAALPGTLGFTLGKGLLSCYRGETPTDLADQDASCYCLPPFFYRGCAHDSPPPFTARLKLDDCMCTVCSKCLRCGKLLGKRCTCHAMHSLGVHWLVTICVAGQAPKYLWLWKSEAVQEDQASSSPTCSSKMHMQSSRCAWKLGTLHLGFMWVGSGWFGNERGSASWTHQTRTGYGWPIGLSKFGHGLTLLNFGCKWLVGGYVGEVMWDMCSKYV